MLSNEGNLPLTPREIRILAAYFVDGLTQTALAASYGISQPRVSQIIAAAKAKLTKHGLPVPVRRHGRPVQVTGEEIGRLGVAPGGQYRWIGARRSRPRGS